MADNDNKELMEFLGKQFEGIYKRLDNTDKRLDNTATKDDLANLATKDDIEDVKRHTGVLVEAVRHDFAIIGEGMMGINEKMGREKEENEREHARLEKMTLINTSDISRLDQRVGRLEGKA
jgi:hypothetical protein